MISETQAIAITMINMIYVLYGRVNRFSIKRQIIEQTIIIKMKAQDHIETDWIDEISQDKWIQWMEWL